MMLVCSNHSEVTDGGSCLQALVTIEQYGLGGRDSHSSLQAVHQVKEGWNLLLSPVTDAPKCQQCLGDPPPLPPPGSQGSGFTTASAFFPERSAGRGPNVELSLVPFSV